MRERVHAAVEAFRVRGGAFSRAVATPVNDLARAANTHRAAPSGVVDVLARVEPALQQLDEAIGQYRDVLIDLTAAAEVTTQ